MMKTTAIVAAMLFTIGISNAGEHPKEHPTGASAASEHPKEKKEPKEKEHPEGHEHPKGHKHEHPAGHEHPVGSKHWTKQMNKEFTATVENHVTKESRKGGFKIQDEKLGKEWNLKLLRVHKNKVVHLGNKKFFACADFKTLEKGKKDKVDLDFYATKTKEGWSVDKVLIHKVNGKARYTYNDKNEMVPVKE